jgi:hypothetical protein
VGPIHFSHSTRADLLNDSVVPESLANHQMEIRLILTGMLSYWILEVNDWKTGELRFQAGEFRHRERLRNDR